MLMGICLQLLLKHFHLNVYKYINKVLVYRTISIIFVFLSTFLNEVLE